MTDESYNKIPTWVFIAFFVAIILILAIFTDVFTLVVGTMIMLIIAANGYNRLHLHED